MVVELRGAESFGNANTLYNPSFSQLGQTSNDTVDGRGNLLLEDRQRPDAPPA